MAIPWTTIITFLLNIGNFLILRSQASAEVKKKWREYVDAMTETRLVSARFKNSWEGIRKRLDDQAGKNILTETNP